MKRTLKVRITTTRKTAIVMSTQRGFCADCDGEVQMLTSRQATDFLEMSETQLAGLIALGKAHAIQSLSGGLQICHDSLLKNRSQKS